MTAFHRTQGNQVFMDEEIAQPRTNLLVSAFVSFSFASGSFLQPIYYTDQIQRSLDSFFQKKVTARNL